MTPASSGNTSPEPRSESRPGLEPPAAPLRWRNINRDLPREHGWEPLRIEGRIPHDLRGTLYRNGPALFSSGGEPYLHAFDGDGALTAIRIAGGRAQGAVRVLETRWLRAERAAGHQLFRSYAQLGRGWRRWLTLPKNPANIAVLPWKGQVLALWEAGLPIQVDPEDLRARGETTLYGRIGPTFSAHPHTLGDTTFNFGVRYGSRFSLDLYEMRDEVRRLGNVPLRFPTLIHDFIPTGRHLVFLCPPRRLHLARLLAGVGSFIENLVWEPQHGTEILVVPRDAPDKCIRLEVPAFFLWHTVAGWEEGGDIFVDFVRYDDDATDGWFGRAPWHLETPPPSTYVRARIDLCGKRFEPTVLSETRCEFPGVDPRMAGARPSDCWMLAWTGGKEAMEAPQLARFDARTGALVPAGLEPDAFPCEPCLVPRPDGGSWLLSLVYDGENGSSYLGVWDSRRWPEPPVAKLWFDHALPLTYHGAWVQGS